MGAGATLKRCQLLLHKLQEAGWFFAIPEGSINHGTDSTIGGRATGQRDHNHI
jgi:hypothetical protein